jgi:hypothetical protein
MIGFPPAVALHRVYRYRADGSPPESSICRSPPNGGNSLAAVELFVACIELGRSRGPRAALALPSRLAETLEHVGVVFRPHPRHAPADIHLEGGRRGRYGHFQNFFCRLVQRQLT